MTSERALLEAEREELLRQLDWLEGEHTAMTALDRAAHMKAIRRRLSTIEESLRSEQFGQ